MRKGTIFAVWNLKGGVGKTTTTINLAYDWAELGGRVLVIDLDPQVNTTPIFTKANELGCTVLDILETSERAGRAACRTKYKNIDIIKGSASLWEGYQEDALERGLRDVRQDYDAIVIDCQPSCGSLVRNALYAADVILTPVVLDRFCLDNLHTVSDIISDIESDKEKEVGWKVFANKVRNICSQKDIYTDLTERSDYPFLDTCISDRAAVPNSLARRKPLRRHAKNNAATTDFEALSREIWEVL